MRLLQLLLLVSSFAVDLWADSQSDWMREHINSIERQLKLQQRHEEHQRNTESPRRHDTLLEQQYRTVASMERVTPRKEVDQRWQKHRPDFHGSREETSRRAEDLFEQKYNHRALESDEHAPEDTRNPDEQEPSQRGIEKILSSYGTLAARMESLMSKFRTEKTNPERRLIDTVDKKEMRKSPRHRTSPVISSPMYSLNPVALQLEDLNTFNDITYDDYDLRQTDNIPVAPRKKSEEPSGRNVLQYNPVSDHEIFGTRHRKQYTPFESYRERNSPRKTLSTTDRFVSLDPIKPREHPIDTTTAAQTTTSTITTTTTTTTSPAPTTKVPSLVPMAQSPFDSRQNEDYEVEDLPLEQSDVGDFESSYRNRHPVSEPVWTGPKQVLPSAQPSERDWRNASIRQERHQEQQNTHREERETYEITNQLLTRAHNEVEKQVLSQLAKLAKDTRMKQFGAEAKGQHKVNHAVRWTVAKLNRELDTMKSFLGQLELLSALTSSTGMIHRLIELQKSYLAQQERGNRNQSAPLTQMQDEFMSSLANTDPQDIVALENALQALETMENVDEPSFQERNLRLEGLSLDEQPSQFEKEKKTETKAHTDLAPIRKRNDGRFIDKRVESAPTRTRFVATPPHAPQRAKLHRTSRLSPVDNVPSVNELVLNLRNEVITSTVASVQQKNQPLTTDNCYKTLCTFEKGDFCDFESSFDELTQRRNRTWSRVKRQSVAAHYVVRSWNNWMGRHAKTVNRVDEAPVFTKNNERFAAVLLDQNQIGMLAVKMSLRSAFIVRFRVWEASHDVQLRVCCDEYCPVSTDSGLHRGDRRWKTMAITCPERTGTFSFECVNSGSTQATCGVDDVFIESVDCKSPFYNK